MKTKILAFIICCLVFLPACKKDGDLIKVSGLTSSELLASESSVVLTKETSASSVLALTWSKSTLSISNSSMGIPGSIPEQVMEVSASADFSTFTEITPSGTTYAFTGAALNTLGKNLGFTVGVSTPMYFRINMAYSDNTESYYSNVATVNVTCYSIDMTKGFILDSDKDNTGFYLYSPNSDGNYYGFTGAGSWSNWYLLEGDGTTWGNLGVDGNAFVISSDESSFWNFWYPGQSGCYYTTLSTGNKEWTATYIPSLTVSGDINATMTFDKATVKWTVSFTTTAANEKIKVSCSSATLYNISTGTTDASVIAKTLGFIPNADSTLTIDWNNASATDITIPAAGDYTLIFSLSDPKSWTYRVKSGITVIVEPISKYLYLPGIDDGISGSWTFNNYLKLVSEDDSTFAGAVMVNSLWGYEMTLAVDEWTNVYQMGSTEGTLAFKSGTNITAPSAGLYLIQADLAKLTYSHTAITGLSYAGLNNSWTMVAMDATSVAGVYSSSVTITSVSTYGCKLYLNGGWDYFYGGADGVLTYAGSGITDDAIIGVGTYDLIANIRNAASYVFLGDAVYISGINDDWSLSDAMKLSKTATGVYSGTITVTTASTYGMTIQLDKSWARYFGGSFSSLTYKGSNITDDQALAVGTYTVTVDFINNTCSFVAQ
jgi:starch-binding outer membrane protein SusE/F